MLDEKLPEKLSLLLDGELNKDESLKLLDLVETDPELKRRWRRYCVANAVLQEKSAIVPDKRFVERVSTAVAKEPTILAPPAKARIREKVVTRALAAVLAMVAVLVGKSFLEHSPTDGAHLIAKAQQGTVLADGNASSMDPDFQDYLVLHNETAYLAGAQGMLPYARLVSSKPTR